MASYAVVYPSWIIFIILFYPCMCSAVWYVSHYIPRAIDHLLISLHLTSGMVISTSQDTSLKIVMPVSMLRPILDLLHCTWLVCKFDSFIRQCLFIMINITIFILLAHMQISVECVRANQTQCLVGPCRLTAM